MFRSFIISAIRNMLRNKVQSIIQIFSLAVGLAVFTMVMLYTYDELTVDRLNENRDQIYRLEDRNKLIGRKMAVNLLMGPVILENIPEIQHMTRIHHLDNFITYLDVSGEIVKQIRIRSCMFVDSCFLHMFPQKFLLGDPLTALKYPHSLVLTESIAKQLFNEENPVGRTVFFDDGRRHAAVTGIIKDPINIHLNFNALVSMTTWNEALTSNVVADPEILRSIMYHARPTYITLHDLANKEEVEKKIEDSWLKFAGELNPTYKHEPDIFLRPLKEVHFSEIDPVLLDESYMKKGDKAFIMNLLLLGLVILLLGIINYVNLATARMKMRSKEITIRKIFGSSRFKLVLFFLLETLIISFFAFLIALSCLQVFFLKFNQLLRADINLYFLGHPLTWITILGGILIIGLLSGIYPAITMSSVSSILSLFGDFKAGGRIIARRFLLVMQFSLAVTIIIGVLIIHLQIRFLKKQDPGIITEKIVWTRVDGQQAQKLQLLSRLKRYPEIEKACFTELIPLNCVENPTLVYQPGSLLHGYDMEFFMASPEFFEVFGLQLTHGGELLDQPYRERITGDTSLLAAANYLVINETARKAIKLGDLLGSSVPVHLEPLIEGNSYIMGVVEDFHFQSHRFPIKPLVIQLLPPGGGGYLSLRLNSSDIDSTLRIAERDIREIMRLVDPGQLNIPLPITFTSINETLNERYDREERIHKASGILLMLTIIIACLGLIGLSIFMVQQRTKEVSIRKVMGSSGRQVFMLLIGDFIKWVGLSILIGCPIGWFIMNKWLQHYAYRTNVSIWVFVLTAAIVMIVALLTVFWQSLKTARANPTEALRYE